MYPIRVIGNPESWPDVVFQRSALLCRDSGEIDGLFLIIGGGEGTALIKSIICSELLLPKPSVPLNIHLSDETTHLVGKYFILIQCIVDLDMILYLEFTNLPEI